MNIVRPMAAVVEKNGPPVVRALHSHTSANVGLLLAVLGALYPVLQLLANQSFVHALVLGDRPTRIELVVTFIVAVAGALLAFAGKGSFAPKAGDDTRLPYPLWAAIQSGAPSEKVEDSSMQGLLQEAKNVAHAAITGLQGMADKALNGTAVDLPALDDKAVQVANDFVDSHASGDVAVALKALIAREESALNNLNPRIAAGIAVFKTDVDSALGHLQQDF